MKHSKLVIFIVAAVLTLSLSAIAQVPDGGVRGGMRNGHGMPSVDDQTKDLTAALKLSDDQSKQVHAILQDQQDQRMKLMQDQSMSREEKMHEIHETATGKIRALLTDDQKKKFDDMEKERQERWQHKKDQQPQGDSTSPQ